MQPIDRRRFLLSSLFASGSVMYRALATGLPAGFLMTGAMPAMAMDRTPTFLVLSHRSSGDPVAANLPGTYPNDPNDSNDLVYALEHAQVSELGSGTVGSVNGTPYSAADFTTPTEFLLGNTPVKAAGPWSSLPAEMRERLNFFWDATYVSGHGDAPQVRTVHGAVRNQLDSGPEELGSMIAQENALALGTLMTEPISVGGDRIVASGRPLPTMRPRNLKSLFEPRSAEFASLTRLRDQAIDEVYNTVRSSGSPAQLEFIDRYANSRSQAAVLGDGLGTLLNSVDGDDSINMARTAAALFALRVTPVVTLSFPFGGDNHGGNDPLLAREVEQTIESVESLRFFWEELGIRGVRDQVTFGSLNVFGRTLRRSSTGGRDHNSRAHNTIMFGPNVVGGVVGGLEPTYRNNAVRDFKARPLNSVTGSTANPDIDFDDLLSSSAKTLAAAAGVPEARIDARIRGGKVVTAALTSV